MEDEKLKSVLKLMKACKKLNIAELKIGDIHIVLDETARSPNMNQSRPAKADEVKAKQIETDSLIEENMQSAEEQLDMMMIEDPLQFEQMLREGELEDAPIGNPQH